MAQRLGVDQVRVEGDAVRGEEDVAALVDETAGPLGRRLALLDAEIVVCLRRDQLDQLDDVVAEAQRLEIVIGTAIELHN